MAVMEAGDAPGLARKQGPVWVGGEVGEAFQHGV